LVDFWREQGAFAGGVAQYLLEKKKIYDIIASTGSLLIRISPK
jgi:hypothetical protein